MNEHEEDENDDNDPLNAQLQNESAPIRNPLVYADDHDDDEKDDNYDEDDEGDKGASLSHRCPSKFHQHANHAHNHASNRQSVNYFISSGSFGSSSGGERVPSTKMSNRPVIHYLPSAGGVKNLGLAGIASESMVTGTDLGGSNANGLHCNNQSRHRPGAVHQVASDVIYARNLGLDQTLQQPIALHEVASETAMALKTGHCNLHRDCSLQGASWQNLCIQPNCDKIVPKGDASSNALGPVASSFSPPLGLYAESRNSSMSHVFIEGKGLHHVSTNNTLDPINGSMMSVSLFPFCRICHMAASDSDEPLISPCRCSGTMKYIHGSCLMKWMDICSRKSRKTQHCELCHFQYTRQKRFQFKEWKLPRSSRRDKLLHFVFLLNLIIMIGCAVATVYCFLSDKGMPKRSRYHHPSIGTHDSSNNGVITGGGGVGSGRDGDVGGVSVGHDDSETQTPPVVMVSTGNSGESSTSDPQQRGQVDLTPEEVITLCCGVLFFISFFVAMYAQIKAKHTLYQLFVRFTVLNTKWEIEEYDPAKDPLFQTLPERLGTNPNQLPVMV